MIPGPVRRLQQAACPFRDEDPPGHLSELALHERGKLRQRIRIPAAPGLQQPGDIDQLFHFKPSLAKNSVLYAVKDGMKTELLPGTLLAPGGVVVDGTTLYVTTGTVFGPGAGSVVRIELS